jgi:hypothetical protein
MGRSVGRSVIDRLTIRQIKCQAQKLVGFQGKHVTRPRHRQRRQNDHDSVSASRYIVPLIPFWQELAKLGDI